MKGEFEQRLRSVIDEVQSSPTPIILFIDEAHTLIGAGGAAGTGDAANLLKPALARGTLRTIAATTWSEYRQYIEKDPALTRRFQPINIGEPEVATAAVTDARPPRADGKASQGPHLRRGDRCGGQAVQPLYPRPAIARQGGQPARHRLRRASRSARTSTPAAVEDARSRDCRARKRARSRWRASAISAPRTKSASPRSRARSRSSASDSRRSKPTGRRSARSSRKSWRCATRSRTSRPSRRRSPDRPERPDPGREAAKSVGETAESVGETARPDGESLLVKIRELEAIEPEKRMIYPHVDEQSVASVVSDWTGIPVGRMVEDEVETILNLAEILNHRVVGQDHGLKMIAKRIETNRAKLDNPNKPIGVFMLAAPQVSARPKRRWHWPKRSMAASRT